MNRNVSLLFLLKSKELIFCSEIAVEILEHLGILLPYSFKNCVQLFLSELLSHDFNDCRQLIGFHFKLIFNLIIRFAFVQTRFVRRD